MRNISIWEKNTEKRTYPSLSENINAEIAVIGAGLAGILTARRLKESGCDVVVIEKDNLGSSQTKNTTAKITLQHGLFYNDLIKDIGEEHARLYAEANMRAIEMYEKMIKNENIDCDFEKENAYLYSVISDEKIREEYNAAYSLGIPCEITSETSLPFKTVSTLRFPNQAQFHPLKFLYAAANGLKIYEHSKVLSVDGCGIKANDLINSSADETYDRHLPRKSELIVKSEHGTFTVLADKVVFACHYPFINIPGYYFIRMHQERSYVLALANVVSENGIYLSGANKDSKYEGMYYCADEDKFSFRRAGSLMLFGGGSHRTGDASDNKYEMLRTAARQYFPQSEETACWSAQDCITGDYIPFIGTYSSDTPNWYVESGFKKWGMTSSMVASSIIDDLINGRENPYIEVFSPQRHNLSGDLKEMLSDGYNAVKGLSKSAADVLTGNKDEDSALTSGEPLRCRHLGCKLAYNPGEDSYDCPCHGSRFTKDGRLIDGPAQEHLT